MGVGDRIFNFPVQLRGQALLSLTGAMVVAEVGGGGVVYRRWKVGSSEYICGVGQPRFYRKWGGSAQVEGRVRSPTFWALTSCVMVCVRVEVRYGTMLCYCKCKTDFFHAN